MSRFDGSTLARALAAVLPTPQPSAENALAAPPITPAVPSDDVLALVTALCIRFEGVYLKPYLCPRGIPTIGVGATFYEDGRHVMLSDPPISRERAMELLRWHITRKFLPAAAKLCPGADTPSRLAALIDFAFNLGESQLAASTLRRVVNQQDWQAARAQHLRWDRAGGLVLAGLTRRCAARAALT